MKLVALAMILSSAAWSAPVFECVDGSRFLRIHDAEGETLRGYLKEFSYQTNGSGSLHQTSRFNCRRSKQGHIRFVCTRGDYLVNVIQAPRKKAVVQVELAGDFFPDSGYLYSLNCK
jgi:hypothetical protein